MLRCDIGLERNGFRLTARVDAVPGEIVAVVGPNGAGKTTLLRVLAGLEQPGSGRLTVDDEIWVDVAAGITLPAERRRVGYVPQAALLFPHLSVRDNVRFGAPAGAADAWLERLGLIGLAPARPDELSGGQAQLVALARAQAHAPKLLLLDEPLASVDVANRASVRRIIRRELRRSRGYRIFVTHDPLEAAALADRIVVLDGGRVVQDGTIEALRSHPRTQYVAELVGVNFFRGVSQAGVIELDGGGTLVGAAAPDGPVLATVHPRAVSLYLERPTGSPRNVWQAPIVAIEPSLEQVRVTVGGPVPIVAEVTRAGASPFTEGTDVWVSVKASEVAAFSQ